MEKIILTGVTLLFLGLFFYYAAKSIYDSAKKKVVFSVSISLCLSIVVCLFEHYLPTFRQGEAMDLAGRFVFNSRISNSINFVKSRMTLVDVTNDSKIVQIDNRGEINNIKVTDRSKLATFINNLNSNPNFNGMLIIDIIFDVETQDDSILREAIQSFVKKHKLVLASSSIDSTVRSLQFDDFIYGDITDQSYSGKYFNHHFIKENGMVSLPFKVYSEINKITSYDKDALFPFTGLRFIKGEDGRHLFIDHMIQFNSIPYDSLSIEGFELRTNEVSLSGIHRVKVENPIIVYNMGDIISEDSVLFNYDLEIKNNNNPMNIIMIGSFKKTGPDLHTTIQGSQVQGSLILASLIENVLNSDALQISKFWLCLFLCFLVITLYEAFCFLRIKKKPDNNKASPTFWFFIKSIFKMVVLNELHFWLLFGSLLIILNSSGRLMNIISLVIFFGAMELIFKVYMKHLRVKEKKD